MLRALMPKDLFHAFSAWRKARRLKTFRYKYLRFPFDNWQYFSVVAEDQAHADELATNVFTEMFNKRQTTMTVFHPVEH